MFIFQVFQEDNPLAYPPVSISPDEQVAESSWHHPRAPWWRFAPLASWSIRPTWERRRRTILRRQQVYAWTPALGKSGGCWARTGPSWQTKDGRKGTGDHVPWPRPMVFSSARQPSGPAGGPATTCAAVLLPSVWTDALHPCIATNR